MTRIGSTIIDNTRRELGHGIIQKWVNCPLKGRYARVKFTVGVRCVRVKNARYPGYGNAGRKPTTRLKAAMFGLTARQYREAIRA